jgi:hypothetical protein
MRKLLLLILTVLLIGCSERIEGDYYSTTMEYTSITFEKNGNALWVVYGIPNKCTYRVDGGMVYVKSASGDFTLRIKSEERLESTNVIDGVYLRNR